MSPRNTTIISLLALLIAIITLVIVINIQNTLSRYESDAAVENISDYPPSGVEAQQKIPVGSKNLY